uniref:CARD domain-containing protein n=1 Tax=Branchiostoma floridae TaxID=7739 RepID=C3YNK0_BRAFL|eukprot:XP_002602083.1 hypothetical protein BRAFLDRAFT_98935 [Branchiostoma floridae]
MHGFTIRWPGGRTVPLGTLLDPHTAQNIILQMHHADEGDGTWQWRIVEILVGGRSAYTVEVNIHQQVSDGQSHSEQDWDRSEPGSTGDEEEKVKDGDGKGLHDKEMDETQQRKLRVNHSQLKFAIKVHHITGYLQERGILTEDEVAKINSGHTQEQRTELLLFLLPKKQGAYEALLQSLQAVQDHTCSYTVILQLLEQGSFAYGKHYPSTETGQHIPESNVDSQPPDHQPNNSEDSAIPRLESRKDSNETNLRFQATVVAPELTVEDNCNEDEKDDGTAQEVNMKANLGLTSAQCEEVTPCHQMTLLGHQIPNAPISAPNNVVQGTLCDQPPIPSRLDGLQTTDVAFPSPEHKYEETPQEQMSGDPENLSRQMSIEREHGIVAEDQALPVEEPRSDSYEASMDLKAFGVDQCTTVNTLSSQSSSPATSQVMQYSSEHAPTPEMDSASSKVAPTIPSSGGDAMDVAAENIDDSTQPNGQLRTACFEGAVGGRCSPYPALAVSQDQTTPICRSGRPSNVPCAEVQNVTRSLTSIWDQHREGIARRIEARLAGRFLVNANVLTEDEFKVIDAEETDIERATTLLNILSFKDQNVVQKFCAALADQGCEDISALITGSQVSNILSPVTNVPKPVKNFLPTRDAKDVHEAIKAQHITTVCEVTGSGKTQIGRWVASQFLRHHPTAVVWVLDGQNHQTLLASMKELLTALNAEVPEEDDMAKVDECLDEALQNRGTPVLLIVDNLEDAALLTPTFMRQRIQCRVLILTCQEDLQLPDGTPFPCNLRGGFQIGEAERFFQIVFSQRVLTEPDFQIDVDHLWFLTEVFDGRPLGLAAVFEYMRNTHTSPVHYMLMLMEDRCARILQQEAERSMAQHYNKFDQRSLHPVFQAAQNNLRAPRDTPKTIEDTEETALESSIEDVNATCSIQDEEDEAAASHGLDDQDSEAIETEDGSILSALSGDSRSLASFVTSEEEGSELEGAVGGISSPPRSRTFSQTGLPCDLASIPPQACIPPQAGIPQQACIPPQAGKELYKPHVDHILVRVCKTWQSVDFLENIMRCEISAQLQKIACLNRHCESLVKETIATFDSIWGSTTESESCLNRVSSTNEASYKDGTISEENPAPEVTRNLGVPDGQLKVTPEKQISTHGQLQNEILVRVCQTWQSVDFLENIMRCEISYYLSENNVLTKRKKEEQLQKIACLNRHCESLVKETIATFDSIWGSTTESESSSTNTASCKDDTMIATESPGLGAVDNRGIPDGQLNASAPEKQANTNGQLQDEIRTGNDTLDSAATSKIETRSGSFEPAAASLIPTPSTSRPSLENKGQNKQPTVDENKVAENPDAKQGLKSDAEDQGSEESSHLEAGAKGGADKDATSTVRLNGGKVSTDGKGRDGYTSDRLDSEAEQVGTVQNANINESNGLSAANSIDPLPGSSGLYQHIEHINEAISSKRHKRPAQREQLQFHAGLSSLQTTVPPEADHDDHAGRNHCGDTDVDPLIRRKGSSKSTLKKSYEELHSGQPPGHTEKRDKKAAITQENKVKNEQTEVGEQPKDHKSVELGTTASQAGTSTEEDKKLEGAVGGVTHPPQSLCLSTEERMCLNVPVQTEEKTHPHKKTQVTAQTEIGTENRIEAATAEQITKKEGKVVPKEGKKTYAEILKSGDTPCSRAKKKKDDVDKKGAAGHSLPKAKKHPLLSPPPTALAGPPSAPQEKCDKEGWQDVKGRRSSKARAETEQDKKLDILDEIPFSVVKFSTEYMQERENISDTDDSTVSSTEELGAGHHTARMTRAQKKRKKRKDAQRRRKTISREEEKQISHISKASRSASASFQQPLDSAQNQPKDQYRSKDVRPTDRKKKKSASRKRGKRGTGNISRKEEKHLRARTRSHTSNHNTGTGPSIPRSTLGGESRSHERTMVKRRYECPLCRKRLRKRQENAEAPVMPQTRSSGPAAEQTQHNPPEQPRRPRSASTGVSTNAPTQTTPTAAEINAMRDQVNTTATQSIQGSLPGILPPPIASQGPSLTGTSATSTSTSGHPTLPPTRLDGDTAPVMPRTRSSGPAAEQTQHNPPEQPRRPRSASTGVSTNAPTQTTPTAAQINAMRDQVNTTATQSIQGSLPGILPPPVASQGPSLTGTSHPHPHLDTQLSRQPVWMATQACAGLHIPLNNGVTITVLDITGQHQIYRERTPRTTVQNFAQNIQDDVRNTSFLGHP